jgi:hypothetical protein
MTQLEGPLSLIFLTAFYSDWQESHIAFIFDGIKKNAYSRRWDQFSCLRYFLASPTLTLVTTTKFVCSIIPQTGNSLFCHLYIEY